MADQYEHAFANAKAWFEQLRELYREAQTELGPARDDAIMQEIDDMPRAGIEVRTAWYVPGTTQPAPGEFNILLTTGGPALRVYGELSERFCEPDSACLQMQDWGVPWREVWPCEIAEMDEARAVILWFAQRFYFGE